MTIKITEETYIVGIWVMRIECDPPITNTITLWQESRDRSSFRIRHVTRYHADHDDAPFDPFDGRDKKSINEWEAPPDCTEEQAIATCDGAFAKLRELDPEGDSHRELIRGGADAFFAFAARSPFMHASADLDGRELALLAAARGQGKGLLS